MIIKSIFSCTQNKYVELAHNNNSCLKIQKLFRENPGLHLEFIEKILSAYNEENQNHKQ
jgi:hypothetical protein